MLCGCGIKAFDLLPNSSKIKLRAEALHASALFVVRKLYNIVFKSIVFSALQPRKCLSTLKRGEASFERNKAFLRLSV